MDSSVASTLKLGDENANFQHKSPFKRTSTPQSEQGNENEDMKADIADSVSPKSGSLRNQKNKAYDDILERDDEEIDPEDVFEEIVLVQQKRKVRFPKSFLPRKPERPRSWALPLDMLIDRPRTTKRNPFIYGSEVKEQVDEKAMNRSISMQDLDNLFKAIDVSK